MAAYRKRDQAGETCPFLINGLSGCSDKALKVNCDGWI
jgi:hypothetical protein